MKLPPNNTKIVATIGPVSNAPEVLEQMIRAGMNVARLNFSHGEFAEHQQNIEHIRSAAKAVGKRVAIIANGSAYAVLSNTTIFDNQSAASASGRFWVLNSCSGETRSFVRPIVPQNPRFQQNMSLAPSITS